MGDLAHANPFRLRKVLGPQNGLRLYALASWGVDRTLIREKVVPTARSIGNFQILPRPYTMRSDILVVLREIVAQVATRLRQQHQLAGSIRVVASLYANSGSKPDGFNHPYQCHQNFTTITGNRPLQSALARWCCPTTRRVFWRTVFRHCAAT